MPTNADHRTIADNVMRRRSNCRRRTKSTVVTVTELQVRLLITNSHSLCPMVFKVLKTK